jgi:hypothetical protein
MFFMVCSFGVSGGAVPAGSGVYGQNPGWRFRDRAQPVARR